MSVIGLRVGPFEIVEATTVPEPGAWYRARRTGMTRRQPTEVLVRLLRPDAEGHERFGLQSMFDTLRAVEDPRVPVAVDVYEGIGALALDAPDGVCFSEIVLARQSGAIDLSPATLLDIALELAECLQHAHHRNRHHGHLGAHNTRLSTAGKLHVFGFGPGPSCEPDPAWISPERRASAESSQATDQWSLAALLAALTVGKLPAEDPEVQLEPLERQWPALARLFRRMLSNDPATRFPSIHPVRQELIALSRKAGGVSERVDLGKRMARRTKRPISPDPSPALPPLELPITTDDENTVDTAMTAAPPKAPEPPEKRPSTEELLEAPMPRRTLETPPAPPVAGRAAAPQAAVKPLVHQPIDVVQPDLAPDDLPVARRRDDPKPDPESDPDEDTSDLPTVRYRPGMMDEFDTPSEEAAILTPRRYPDPTPLAADLENSGSFMSPEAVTRALVMSDHGGAPTAVPVTDSSDDDDEAWVLTEAHEVATESDQGGHQGQDQGREPDLPLLELPDDPPPAPTREDTVKRMTPWLILGMVLLMFAAVALTLR